MSCLLFSGCLQWPPFSDPISNPLGPPEPIPPEVFEPVTYEPIGADEGDYYTVVDSEATYDESSGTATFSWKVHTKDEEPPASQKIACVTPKELPDRFWEYYDSGEPLLDRENVDKQWRDLYIPLDEYGIAQFSMKTRIPGSYEFELCGILDNDYSNKTEYGGDGSLTIEVPDQGLIVVETECEDQAVYDTMKYTTCQWKMEFANGSEFNCWEKRPYTDMNSTEGKTSEGVFEILVDRGMEKEYYIVNAPMRLCGGSECGCGFGPYIGIRVEEGETVTLSIVKVNEEFYSYKGDGDPITVTMSE